MFCLWLAMTTVWPNGETLPSPTLASNKPTTNTHTRASIKLILKTAYNIFSQNYSGFCVICSCRRTLCDLLGYWRQRLNGSWKWIANSVLQTWGMKCCLRTMLTAFSQQRSLFSSRSKQAALNVCLILNIVSEIMLHGVLSTPKLNHITPLGIIERKVKGLILENVVIQTLLDII